MSSVASVTVIVIYFFMLLFSPTIGKLNQCGLWVWPQRHMTTSTLTGADSPSQHRPELLSVILDSVCHLRQAHRRHSTHTHIALAERHHVDMENSHMQHTLKSRQIDVYDACGLPHGVV